MEELLSPDWYQVRHSFDGHVKGSGYTHDESDLTKTTVSNVKKDNAGIIKAITTVPARTKIYELGNARYDTGLFSNQVKHQNKVELFKGLMGS